MEVTYRSGSDPGQPPDVQVRLGCGVLLEKAGSGSLSSCTNFFDCGGGQSLICCRTVLRPLSGPEPCVY